VTARVLLWRRTSNAGGTGLGYLASATMTIDEIEEECREGKGKERKKYKEGRGEGVENRRDDAERARPTGWVDMNDPRRRQVASFAIGAQKQELISKLKERGEWGN